MPYFTSEKCQGLVGKTVAAIQPRNSTGSVRISFTDGSVLQLDAAVEHEKVSRQVNLIVNDVTPCDLRTGDDKADLELIDKITNGTWR